MYSTQQESIHEMNTIKAADQALRRRMIDFVSAHGWTLVKRHWTKTFHPPGQKSYKRELMSVRLAFELECRYQTGE